MSLTFSKVVPSPATTTLTFPSVALACTKYLSASTEVASLKSTFVSS